MLQLQHEGGMWSSRVLSCQILGLLKEQVLGSPWEASPPVPLGLKPAYGGSVCDAFLLCLPSAFLKI